MDGTLFEGPYLEILGNILAPVLTGLILWILAQLGILLARWRDSTKNKLLKDAIDFVGGVALTTVASTAQVATNQIKAATKDGKLTDLEARLALDKSVENVWLELNKPMRKLLLRESDGTEKGAKQQYIVPRIEEAVLEVKNISTGIVERKREAGISAQEVARAQAFIGVR